MIIDTYAAQLLYSTLVHRTLVRGAPPANFPATVIMPGMAEVGALQRILRKVQMAMACYKNPAAAGKGQARRRVRRKVGSQGSSLLSYPSSHRAQHLHLHAAQRQSGSNITFTAVVRCSQLLITRSDQIRIRH